MQIAYYISTFKNPSLTIILPLKKIFFYKFSLYGLSKYLYYSKEKKTIFINWKTNYCHALSTNCIIDQYIGIKKISNLKWPNLPMFTRPLHPRLTTAATGVEKIVIFHRIYTYTYRGRSYCACIAQILKENQYSTFCCKRNMSYIIVEWL